MRWLLLVLVLVAIAVFVLLKRKQGTHSGGDDKLPYCLGDGLFTPAERSFLGVLDQVVGADFRVMGKVRVADVIAVTKGTPKATWQRAFNRISAKHFDFVLCRKTDLKPVCVIELNDQSHAKDDRKARDTFLDGVCAVAGLSLIFIPAQKSYQLNEVCHSIAAVIGGLAPLSVSVPPKVKEEFVAAVTPGSADISIEASTDPACPRCSSPMIRRIAKTGENAGKEFWGCTKFPACRGTVFP